MPDAGPDLDIRAEKLYNAVLVLLHDRGAVGLLVAVGDARDGVPWYAAASKTREVFRHLVVNLTDGPPIA
jgi:hypothetical protein